MQSPAQAALGFLGWAREPSLRDVRLAAHSGPVIGVRPWVETPSPRPSLSRHPRGWGSLSWYQSENLLFLRGTREKGKMHAYMLAVFKRMLSDVVYGISDLSIDFN